ncbi:hypothetical protein [Xanthobacter sp. 126]|uniref:hypothetical protein n=1 Tax=Xanthobacter TaxID=279 RepID=UPI00045EB266|nr:hypothetical protein [Xanthobacter sp. 126]
MAKVSKIKAALTGAAVAGLVLGAVMPSQAAGLWGERFASLRSQANLQSSSRLGAQSTGGYKWSLIQYRAYKYDQRISKFLGRPVSPFCRFFC